MTKQNRRGDRWNVIISFDAKKVTKSYEDLCRINEIASLLRSLPPAVSKEITGDAPRSVRNRAEIVADWYFDALRAKNKDGEER